MPFTRGMAGTRTVPIPMTPSTAVLSRPLRDRIQLFKSRFPANRVYIVGDTFETVQEFDHIVADIIVELT